MQWIGARNPVRTRSSCAAVTGYDFPRANRFGGEGGKKAESVERCSHRPVAGARTAHRAVATTKNSQLLQKPGARIFDRSNSFVSPRVRMIRKNFFAKRRMRAGRCAPPLRDKQVRLSELEETCYAKSPIMFCNSISVERTRLACWRWRPAIADFSEDCFGETPKPIRETRVLPRFLSLDVAMDVPCFLVGDHADHLHRTRRRKIDNG